MRISTTQLFTETTRNMMSGQSSLAEIQNKISSGKNFQSLAEDPVGANQVVNLKRELNQIEMYQRNIDATRRRLSLEDTTLADINNGVTRARELVIQAGNGAMSDSERFAISYELEELVDFLAGLMNTRDAKGEYLFSGSKGTTESFQKQLDGTFIYGGDNAQREIQVASSQYVDSSDNGQFLFQSVVSNVGLEVLGDSADALVSAVSLPDDLTITDAEAFEAAFRETGDLSIAVDNGGVFSIADSAGTALTAPEYGYDAVNGEIFIPGATLELSALTNDTSATLRFDRNEGNILNTLVANVEALRTLSTTDPAQSAELNENLAVTLEQIDAVEERLGQAIATIGARLNIIDSSELSNDDFGLLTQSTLSAVEDLDYASASTELARRQLALEASFASFAKIQGLTLFNYIN